MGLVRTDQIRNASGLGNADLFKQWASKALLTYNQSAHTIASSKNVSSVTDGGVGLNVVTLTSAMSNANPTVAATLGQLDTNNFTYAVRLKNTGTELTASTVALVASYWNGTALSYYDFTKLFVTVSGDLA